MNFSLNHILIALLLVALGLTFVLYRNVCAKLDLALKEVSQVTTANDTLKEAVCSLEKSRAVAERILQAWDNDRTTLQELRSATSQAIKEALHEESFKSWYASTAPAAVPGLLSQSGRADPNRKSVPARNLDEPLPANAFAGEGTD